MTWRHYPPVPSLSDEDKQRLAARVGERAAAFKPKFEGVYNFLEKRPGVDLAELRKAECLDKAFAAGVKVTAPAAADPDFVTTGNPEVIVRRKSGPLYAFDRIKGDDMQMCAGMALYMAYPPQLVAVWRPDGAWEAAY